MVKVFYGLSMRKFWCILLMAQMLSVGAETLRVMQLNVWNSGYGVPGARVMIGDEIKKHRPDIVFLCECVKDRIVDDLLAQLKSADLQYYGSRLDGANQVISRFPIVQEALLPSAYKAVLNPDNGQKIVAYSVHLNYRNYACYLPRGYSGETWKKLSEPVTDLEKIVAMNLASGRPEAIRAITADAREHIATGDIVVLGGDFNEPSWRDWGEETKNLYDHNGTVISWHSTALLEKNGFRDSYRELYPNPVTHPGFTYPCDNSAVSAGRLSWAPEADERDRIDFIFYHPGKLKLERVILLGPQGMIKHGERDLTPTADPVSSPKDGRWPSDHRGNLADFVYSEAVVE